MMSTVKPPDTDYQQCHYCKEWYYAPVAYYHTEDECLSNQKQQAEEAE